MDKENNQSEEIEEVGIEKSKDNSSSEDQEGFNWESSVANKNQKKNYGILGLFLLGLLAVTLIFIWGDKNKKSSNTIVQEPEEFESIPKRQVFIPEASVNPPANSENKSLSKEELEKQKKTEALKEARLRSGIIMHQSSSNAQNSQSPENHPTTIDSSSRNIQDPNSKFQQEAQKNSSQGSKATFIGGMDKMILQGKLIDAVLETAINSDLPGMVRAIVSRDIYGESENTVLIPKGSRLIGQYNSTIQKGQSRIFVIWDRVIRPDGIDVVINSNGTDPLGRAGLSGRVNNHFWKIFGTSTLLSIIGAGASNGGVNQTDQFNSLAAYRQEMANSFSQSAQTVLGQYANIPPMIQVKQGKLIKIFVARDLDFSEALADSQNRAVIFP